MKRTVLTLGVAFTLLLPSVTFASLGVVSVPEPSIALCIVAGIGAVAAARLRRKR